MIQEADSAQIRNNCKNSLNKADALFTKTHSIQINIRRLTWPYILLFAFDNV